MVRWKASRSFRLTGTERMAPTCSRVRRLPGVEEVMVGKPPR